MLEKIEFGARDQELVDCYNKAKASMAEKLAANKTKLLLASIQVRVNAVTIISGDWSLEIADDDYPNYKTLREMFSALLEQENAPTMLNMDDEKLLEPIKDDSSPDSAFWLSVSDSHYTQDGGKLPNRPDIKKYDIDVSLFMNGGLIYHGWQLVGSNHTWTVQDVVQIAFMLPISGMSNAVDKPTIDEIKSFPW